MSNSFDLEGTVVVLTGGAGLLGRRYTNALSEAGAHVVVADIDGSTAKVVAAQVPGAEAMAAQVDIRDPDDVNRMVAAVLERFQRVDALINNAALDPKFDASGHGKNQWAFEDFPYQAWEDALAVNLTGAFLCTRAVIPAMLEQRRGVIVNVSSTYGICGPDQRLYIKDDPNAPRSYKPVTYTVTKSALIGFTKYLATYYGEQGIRANTLTIGGVYNAHDPEFVRRYGARTPMGRMAERDEYCGAIVFLVSDASSYMTGANLVIDGGWSAW